MRIWPYSRHPRNNFLSSSSSSSWISIFSSVITFRYYKLVYAIENILIFYIFLNCWINFREHGPETFRSVLPLDSFVVLRWNVWTPPALSPASISVRSQAGNNNFNRKIVGIKHLLINLPHWPGKPPFVLGISCQSSVNHDLTFKSEAVSQSVCINTAEEEIEFIPR